MNPDFSLAEQTIVAIKKGAPPLDMSKVLELLEQIPQWRMEKNAGINQLVRTFQFPDLTQALAFSKAINAMADEANHHPVQQLEENLLTMRWWTHSIKGLHLNDFIMAARCDHMCFNN
jgi:4a-hydroxytetrahydrobiopterin dehydratase